MELESDMDVDILTAEGREFKIEKELYFIDKMELRNPECRKRQLCIISWFMKGRVIKEYGFFPHIIVYPDRKEFTSQAGREYTL